MIPFNIPPFFGTELAYVEEAIKTNRKICGDGPFTKRCHAWLEEHFGCQKALLTTSGTTALEMAALLCDLIPGDEVILPSYTFSTTATAFVLVGAKLVFVDIRPDTMNIDERKIEAAITERTRVIVPVHYAGVACEMDTIMDIAHRHGLRVVEDAAQGAMSTYKGRALGTIGDFGCLSFHETKNYSMGEGGAILINDPSFNDRAEIIREKGTNRQRFLKGQVDKYTWEEYGSSYLPSDMNAAYLWGELEHADEINQNRLASWDRYNKGLAPLADRGLIELPQIPVDCKHNAHMFYIKLRSLDERQDLIEHLKSHDISAVFHYIPLHSSPAGKRYGRFFGTDEVTSADSDRLLRLPLYYGIDREDIDTVVAEIERYFDREVV
ncbi:dTDP-4-amino-4,6-dideoxygalactose transaminase [Collinsella sp. AGMB00827]|uniref:dTDP-4-amino-4,6-dideoxygalactose transaminase n=1 Tax=Collinsella ureilytica TaxID=2869515 RepID=A0ABS7MI77_9ACTN|nr:dTDP-4-amino-4,6-dideoxygalactose transaminase [Collinsella urealyticum]